jgi:Uma2 family endonuclease
VYLDEFDPLVELSGLWTMELAERYLPIEGVAGAKYECVDGYLIISSRGTIAHSWAAARLAALLHDPAQEAGKAMYMRPRFCLGPQQWTAPDLVVLRQPARQTWTSVELALLAVELVRNDRIDKPALYAEAGVPYLLTVELTDHEAHVELLRLDDSGKYVVQAKALAGQEFRTELPFPLSFDPAVLLEP